MSLSGEEGELALGEVGFAFELAGGLFGELFLGQSLSELAGELGSEVERSPLESLLGVLEGLLRGLDLVGVDGGEQLCDLPADALDE